MGPTDSYGRTISYLRISVTDRCNFRCFYCLPSYSIQWMPESEILSYDEIIRIIQAAARMGVSKIRITGGEPLMRPGLLSFISEIKSIPGIRDLSMTTNGSRLKEYAFALKNAGLDHINISLDTLQSQRFLSITGCDMFNRVIEGINVAEQVGLLPIKINVVVVYGINNDELVDFARMTRNNSYQIRFIECMPFWPNSTNPKRLVPVVEMKEILASGGFRILEAEPSDSGPAQVYRIPGALGTLGFISPVTNHFCGSCNRIRLTSDGRIRPCLISNDEFNIKALLRFGASDSDIETHLKQAILGKPYRHNLEASPLIQRRMSQIGG